MGGSAETNLMTKPCFVMNVFISSEAVSCDSNKVGNRPNKIID